MRPARQQIPPRIGVGISVFGGDIRNPDREVEYAALTFFASDADVAAHHFTDLVANRETKAGSAEFRVVEAST